MNDFENNTADADADWKAQCMAWCRQERNSALAKTDYIFLPDVSASEDSLAKMKVYRQALRDFVANWEKKFDAMSQEKKYGVTDTAIAEQIDMLKQEILSE